MKKSDRPPIESLACVNRECPKYGQACQGNLIVRKTYGRDHIRYLRCRACSVEFSERKNTPLWNTKIREGKAVAVAEHLAEGASVKATARLTRVCPATIRQLTVRLGRHATRFHDQHVQRLSSTSLQADERWGFAGSKRDQLWQAEVIDPATRLVVSYATGRRNEALLGQIMRDAAARLSYPQGVVLFTDGEPSYEKLFRWVFGRAYRPSRKGSRGRFPKVRYRLTRRQAHVVVRKTRQGRRVVKVDVRVAHGSGKRVTRGLSRLGFTKPNTSAIERRNGTARSMDSTSVRKTLAFAKTPESRAGLGAWGVLVYNWARECRPLRRPLPQPQGRRV